MYHREIEYTPEFPFTELNLLPEGLLQIIQVRQDVTHVIEIPVASLGRLIEPLSQALKWFEENGHR